MLADWCKNTFSCSIFENAQIERWNVDILIESRKLIVEYFGTWWHTDPRKFDDNYVHVFTRKTAKSIRERDARKIEYLTSVGYNVVVVWENDWKENNAREKERIIDAYNRI